MPRGKVGRSYPSSETFQRNLKLRLVQYNKAKQEKKKKLAEQNKKKQEIREKILDDDLKRRVAYKSQLIHDRMKSETAKEDDEVKAT